MKKRCLTLILALTLLCALLVPAYADESGFDTATRESVAVVYTCLDTNGGELGFGWGTGFFVGPQGEDPTYLVTNHHVIEDFIDYGEGELYDYTIGGQTYKGRTKIRVYYDSGTYDEAYIVEYSSSKDVAVLKLANPTSLRKPIPLAVPDDSAVGSTVYAIGYPGLSENLFAGATTSWGISDVTVTRGAISRILTTEGTGQALIQIDCDIKPGNSGGPLVNASGAAIGINTKSVSNASGDQTNYAVNISEAITLLNRNGVAYTDGASSPAAQPPEQTDDPDAQPASQVDTPAQTEAPVEPAQTEAPVEPAPKGGINIGLVIGIAAAAVALAVLAVLLLRKKPAQSIPQTQPGPFPVNPPAAQEVRIQGQSGTFAGRRFAVNGQLRIGRDPGSNDLVYPNGAPGISGRHCVVTLYGGQVTLTDLGSSYGTFLAGGQKLAPNQAVTLRIGDRFYLGSEKESFVITGKGGGLS